MKALEVLCRGFIALLLVNLSAATARAELLAQWNFNSVPPDAAVSTGTNVPSFGVGTAALVGGATATYATGATGDPAGMADNSGWNTAGYPAQGVGNKTRGVQFNVSTLGFERIVVTWAHRHSSTSSRYVRFQYSADGTNFVDGPVFTASAQDTFFSRTADLSSFPVVNNTSNFAFRLVSEFESTAIESSTNQYVATTAGQTYSGNGTWRLDMVAISGEIFSDNQFPSVSSISNQSTRVNTQTPEIPFTVGDAETAADQLLVTATSSDQTLVPNDGIFLGGSGSNRTVSIFPAFDQTGSATITLTVTDNGGKFTTTSFVLTVIPANTPPTNSAFSSYNTVMNVPF
ncbi:MAG TPA: hypothetical protein VK615_07475, partial [Candidatus Binatia bacterium]|nr:hypothetical protein [Candidatus Binatia bacterium]